MIGAVLTIARRDILATVFTRGFLVWLLMPLIGMGVGLFAATLADDEREADRKQAVAVLDPAGTLRPWLQIVIDEAGARAAYADVRIRHKSKNPNKPLPAMLAPLPEDLPPSRLRDLAQPGAVEALVDAAGVNPGRFGSPVAPAPHVTLLFVPVSGDIEAQTRRLLAAGEAGRGRFDAVLRLDGRDPRLIAAPKGEPDADAVASLLNEARERRALAAAGLDGRLQAVRTVRQPLTVERPVVAPTSDPGSAAARTQQGIGRGVATVLFMLIGLLAGVLLSNMVEEKANKVIEVLVASVPVPAIFAGKLVAMLAISLIGVAVWASLIGGAAAVALAGASPGLLPTPPLGWPTLLALAGAYFVTAYLIYGAIYLGVGSLCSSIREVQSLSTPVTITQTVVLLGVFSAIGKPDGVWATVMSWFPLSSPYMMAARTATGTPLMVHLLAIGWQLAFAALVILASSRLFRTGVLNSGPPPGLFALQRQKSSLS